MDSASVVNQIIGNVWYLIPITILIAILKSPWFKGVFGELVVNVSANLMLDKDEYHLVKNVTLPTETGTTQIDHIIVSRYGVALIIRGVEVLLISPDKGIKKSVKIRRLASARSSVG